MVQDNKILSSEQVLTGRQEHYLKRELLSQQVTFEITELSSPSALQRFGAPFKSEFGEVSPLESELPILRYIFVHFLRKFPFLDQAREKEFWQDKLQVFLESFANKHISSSEDRLEETKRRKLSLKCQKMIELMMVSGISTASGYEERIRFSELEVVDSGAIEHGLVNTLPEGHYTNGWDVNIAGVRTITVKRKLRHHKHAEFILRVKREGSSEIFIGRRYGDFDRLHKRIIMQLPGKTIPSLPKKNKQDFILSSLLNGFSGNADDDASSVSTGASSTRDLSPNFSLRSMKGHQRMTSSSSKPSISSRSSVDETLSVKENRNNDNINIDSTILWRETQRISMRSFIRTLLSNPQIAQTKAIDEFLTSEPIQISDSDIIDITKRKLLDEGRVAEQNRFYEIARKRAAELDVYMEQFRQNIIENNGLTQLLQEVKEKPRIQDLSFEYRKLAEWLRIEVAATIYHLFLAEDNSPELFAQIKKIHSMIPYTIVKNAIRFANPAAVMSSILDIFLARPFGARSLMQRIFSLTLNDGIRNLEKNINAVVDLVDEPIFCQKLKNFCNADETVKNSIRQNSHDDSVDLIVAILRDEELEPPLKAKKIGKIFDAYMAWTKAATNVNEENRSKALLFSHLKLLLKLYTRQRDKAMMLSMIEESVTLQLFRDLFTIFYEPLVRVYKSANIHNRVTDFSDFMDDMIRVVERYRDEEFSADPNRTVQAFIDLCARHEHNMYGFIHEVHTNDNGLFLQLINWTESIINFLRHGPRAGKLDINQLFAEAVSVGRIDQEKAIQEINSLIAWQEARKKWHQNKTRQKMAADGSGSISHKLPGNSTFHSSDFGLDQNDLDEIEYDDTETSSFDDDQDDLNPILTETQLRDKITQGHLRRSAGEPIKPTITELRKLTGDFLKILRKILSE